MRLFITLDARGCGVGFSPRMSEFDPIQSFSSIGCERRESAINGRSLGPRARSACGSESGRSENAPQTAGFDPFETFGPDQETLKSTVGPSHWRKLLALPQEVKHWWLTTLREKLIKIGAKIMRHGRYVSFQPA